MKVSNEFIQAKKDKGLCAMLVIKRTNEAPIIRLCIDEKSKYSDRIETAFIETETTISIDNYALHKGVEIGKICFHLYAFNFSPVHTFLNAIKKDSEISFKVIAYNASGNLDAVNFVSHKLYGIIDSKIFLLDIYTGPNNTASPIQ